MIEEWRKIDSYPNYSVSNLGRVRNDKVGNILKPAKAGCRKSYLYVLLYNGTQTSRKLLAVHRLVATAFIPNPENKPEVNHLDGNGFNNIVSNLEWITRKDNILHAYQVLNRKVAIGKATSKRVIRVEDGHIFNSLTEAAISCGLSNHTSISHCVSGKRQKAGGYHWKYADIGG